VCVNNLARPNQKHCRSFKVLKRLAIKISRNEISTKFWQKQHAPYTVGWVDIGTRTKVPLRFVPYLSKVSETDEKMF
jgi:hypothetical protein